MPSRSFRALSPAVLAACAALFLSLQATPSKAALGGTPMQTPNDATAKAVSPSAARVSAKAALGPGSIAPTNYSVTETTFASGTVVREYLATDGTVFGVAWRGPYKPDLETLLGSYFPQYVSGAQAQRAQRGVHGQLAIDGTTLVVRSGGHLGAFAGQAWLPAALPAGVSGDDIQ
jgi:hypothetical protein